MMQGKLPRPEMQLLLQLRLPVHRITAIAWKLLFQSISVQWREGNSQIFTGTKKIFQLSQVQQRTSRNIRLTGLQVLQSGKKLEPFE